MSTYKKRDDIISNNGENGIEKIDGKYYYIKYVSK